MTVQTRARLDATLAQVCPIHGTSGPQEAVRIDYAPSATPAQIAAADAALAAFDWSPAAQDAWVEDTIKAEAKAWILGNTVAARAFRAQSLVLLDQINALRTAAGLTPPSYTSTQFLNAVVARVDVTP